MVVVMAVSISLIWGFLAFIGLFPNNLLLIWVIVYDKSPSLLTFTFNQYQAFSRLFG